MHRPNICSCIWKVVFTVPSFSFSFFKYSLLPYSFWRWGKKETTIIMLDNQFSMKISLNISNNFLWDFWLKIISCIYVWIYIHIYLGAPRIWVQDEEYIYVQIQYIQIQIYGFLKIKSYVWIRDLKIDN